MRAFKNLATAIRASCVARVWDQGLLLARDHRVVGVRAAADEVVLRVQPPGGGPTHEVVLYPQDDEWECDCTGAESACSHVCAAILALMENQRAGQTMPQAKTACGSLEYHLERFEGGLSLQRYVVDPSGTRRLLRTPASAQTPGSVHLTQDDINVDRLLGTRMRGRIALERLANLFRLLNCIENIVLDGMPIRVSEEAIGPQGLVVDHGDGIRFTIDKVPEIEVVAAGVIRIGETLHLAGATDITGLRLEKLPIVHDIDLARIGGFVTGMLPAVADQIEIEIRTNRLPTVMRSEAPRMVVDLKQDGNCLTAQAAIVYGDPEIARLDKGILLHKLDTVPTRDFGAEKRLENQMRAALDLRLDCPVMFRGKQAVEFVRRLDDWDRSLARGSLGARLRETPLTPRICSNHEAVEVLFEALDDNGKVIERARASDVIAAWAHGENLVGLENGGFAPLPSQWLSQHGHRVADLLAAGGNSESLPAHAAPIVAELCDALEHPRPAGMQRLAPLIDGFDGLPAAVVPGDVRAELRPYQMYGVRWMMFLREAKLGALLADDMGLGKTLQVLCLAKGRTLVVCPSSIMFNWVNEIERFRPSLNICVFHGPKRSLKRADVTLTTYALLRQDIGQLAKHHWDVAILDEAHMIKNPTSQTAQAAFQLQADFRVAMSGTPVENRLEELWSLFHFINPGFLGGQSDFRQRYIGPIQSGDESAVARLNRKIRAFVLRRTKMEVVPELPPRTDVVMHCELSDEERIVYDTVRVAARKHVVSLLESSGNVMAALETLLRLRQAACHPALVPGQEARSSAKVAALLLALEQISSGGNKALVFSQWTSFLDLIEPHLVSAGINFVRLDGKTKHREEIVKVFQSANGPPILLVSLKAGGTGLNLTSADHVFLCDPWWNPAAEDQAADRAHRIGQTKPVIVYKLVAKGTVEERILALQAKKRSLAESALTGARAGSALSRDDLLELLR